MAREALYYPYIHVQNANWLKGTLLLFDRVQRMLPRHSFSVRDGTPTPFIPGDSREIQEFTALKLLTPADIDGPRPYEAQTALVLKLQRDARKPSFRERYGRAAARQRLSAKNRGFQIHRGKVTGDVLGVLGENGLAWMPGVPEPYDRRGEYVEVHRRIGQAIMSTLAVACATSEGLDIVGDRRSKGLHRCLLKRDAGAVYDAWLKTGRRSPPVEAQPRELFEFVVGFGCDFSAVTLDKLLKLRDEREPLQRLMDNLRERARHIPKMDRGEPRLRYFREQAKDVLGAWEKDRKNLSPFSKAFWTKDAASLGTKYVQGVVDKTTVGAMTGAAAGVAASAGSSLALGHLVGGALLGAAPGLAVGVVAHGLGALWAGRTRKLESPYHFLTLMEKSGVVFRASASVDD